MPQHDGYRLKARSIADLSAILDAYRADALRILGRRYGSIVADLAVEEADLRLMKQRAADTDAIAKAISGATEALRTPSSIPYSEINCVIDIHLIRDAVLARFVHGDDDYLERWISHPAVVPWGIMHRPQGISDQAWKVRNSFWKALETRRGIADTLRFCLLDDGPLPSLGWGIIKRLIPPYEARLDRAAEALVRDGFFPDTASARRAATKALPRELVREHFLPQTTSIVANGERTKPPVAAPKPQINRAAQLVREQAARARRMRAEHKPPEKAASIDHADIVVSADGRTFVAVPYVGLDTQTRVFIQVGDNHVAVSQGGVQFGYVTDVQKSALDHLRHCRTVTVVEVKSENDRRLLRAKHIAIVSDIGLAMSVNVAFGRLKKPMAANEQEIKEWASSE